MFLIKIAGVVVELSNRYDYIQRLCQDYIVSDAVPDFSVSASPEELRQERERDSLSCGDLPYYESLCLYRKLCLRMVDYDGFLMHSAVIEVDGQAIAFAAKSGVGKSTHIYLWRERFGSGIHIINGDKPIYRFMDGRLCACGTPWRGKEFWGENRIAPLKALCFLERAEENKAEPMTPKSALPRLFHQLLLPKEAERMDRFLPLIGRMLDEIPCWRLCCNATPEAAETAKEALMRGAAT